MRYYHSFEGDLPIVICYHFPSDHIMQYLCNYCFTSANYLTELLPYLGAIQIT